MLHVSVVQRMAIDFAASCVCAEPVIKMIAKLCNNFYEKIIPLYVNFLLLSCIGLES